MDSKMTDTKLTPDELAEWLAVNVLKWDLLLIEVFGIPKLQYVLGEDDPRDPGVRSTIRKEDFTPTTDLNHTKMVWDALTVEQQDILLVNITANIVGDFRKLDYTRLACALRVVAETMQDPDKLSRAIYAVVKGE